MGGCGKGPPGWNPRYWPGTGAQSWDMGHGSRDRDKELERRYEPGTGAQDTEAPAEARNKAVRTGTWFWN